MPTRRSSSTSTRNDALVGDGGFKSFWEMGYLLRGYDRFFMDLVVNPDFVDALLGRLF